MNSTGVIHTEDADSLTTTKSIFDAYVSRSWSIQAKRQRDKGLEFVIGNREGPYIWNIEGSKRLIDCATGGGVHSLGHRHPEVLAALRNAIDGPYDAGLWAFPAREYVRLQDLLTRLAPTVALNRALITLSSTASVDMAVACARRFTQRRKIIAYRHGYHGHSGFAALVTGSLEEGVIDFYNLPREESAFFEKYNDLNSLARLLTVDVAGVIIEPMDYETFEPASPAYLEGVGELCEQRGIQFILDETRTGLGRTGKLWAAEHYKVQPDLLITGKGLSGGMYPVSAVLMRDEIYDRCLNGHKFSYISSLGGNEIACLVAQRVLQLSTADELLQNVRMNSRRLEGYLRTLADRHPDSIAFGSSFGCILTIRLKESMRAPEFYRAVINAGVLPHGFSLIEPAVLKLFPVLTMSARVADEIAESLERALHVYES